MKDTSIHYEILNCTLSEHPEGISIQEVADLTGIHRNTAAKYLEVLQSQGEVDVRRVGVSKLFFISKRVPFSAILRLYDDPIIGIDRDLQIVELNPSALSLLGSDEKSIIGSNIRELEHLLGAGIGEKIKETIKGQWEGWEDFLKNPSILIRGIPVKFSDSRTGAAILCIDQNKALAVKAELERCDKTLRMITRYQSEYMYRLSPDMRYLWVNTAYARLFNLTPDIMAGTRLSLPVSEDERNIINKVIRESKPEGNAVEYKVHLPHGDIRYHHFIYRPYDGEDEEQGFIGVGRDITEYKFKEEQFKRFYDGTEEILAERTKELRNLNHQLYQEIATREQAEQALRSIEFAVQHVADMIIWFDPTGKMIYVNKAATNTLKLPEFWHELTFFSLLPIPPCKDWKELWDSLRKEKTIFYETILTTTDGKTVPVEILFNHLIYDTNEYCCCIARDIQHQKQAMAELIESENRFRQLADAIPEAFFLFDNKTRKFLYVNQAYEEIFGLQVSELYQDHSSWKGRVHPDDLERVRRQIKDAETNQSSFEFRIIRSDRVRWLDIRVIPIFDPASNSYRTVGVISDITERKLMEEELRLLNDRLTTVIRATPVSIFNQDRDLRYIWFGQSSIGLTQDEVIGKTDSDLFPSDIADHLTTIKKSALKTGNGGHVDLDIALKGRRWTFRMFFEPFRDSAGIITGITVAGIDLTDLFHVKEALRESEEKYRRLFDKTSDICLVLSIIRDEQGEVVDLQYIDANQRIINLIGKEKPDLIGKRLSHFNPDDDPQWVATLFEVSEKEEPLNYNGYSNLLHRHVSVNAYPIGDDRIGVVARDITDTIHASELVENQRDLAISLASTDEIAEALSLILDAGKNVACIDSGGIYFLDQEENNLILQSHFGLNSDFISDVNKIEITPHMKEFFGRGEPVYYPIDETGEVPPSTRIMIREGLKFFVVLPILRNGLLYAILNLASHSSSDIAGYERSYLQALGAHLGEALERIRRNKKEHADNPENHPFFQIIDQEGKLIEGSTPRGWNSSFSAGIQDLIQNSRNILICGQEVSGELKPDSEDYLFSVRIRFIPWDGEIAYLVIIHSPQKG